MPLDIDDASCSQEYFKNHVNAFDNSGGKSVNSSEEFDFSTIEHQDVVADMEGYMKELAQSDEIVTLAHSINLDDADSIEIYAEDAVADAVQSSVDLIALCLEHDINNKYIEIIKEYSCIMDGFSHLNDLMQKKDKGKITGLVQKFFGHSVIDETEHKRRLCEEYKRMFENADRLQRRYVDSFKKRTDRRKKDLLMLYEVFLESLRCLCKCIVVAERCIANHNDEAHRSDDVSMASLELLETRVRYLKSFYKNYADFDFKQVLHQDYELVSRLEEANAVILEIKKSVEENLLK